MDYLDFLKIPLKTEGKHQLKSVDSEDSLLIDHLLKGEFMYRYSGENETHCIYFYLHPERKMFLISSRYLLGISRRITPIVPPQGINFKKSETMRALF